MNCNGCKFPHSSPEKCFKNLKNPFSSSNSSVRGHTIEVLLPVGTSPQFDPFHFSRSVWYAGLSLWECIDDVYSDLVNRTNPRNVKTLIKKKLLLKSIKYNMQ